MRVPLTSYNVSLSLGETFVLQYKCDSCIISIVRESAVITV